MFVALDVTVACWLLVTVCFIVGVIGYLFNDCALLVACCLVCVLLLVMLYLLDLELVEYCWLFG